MQQLPSQSQSPSQPPGPHIPSLNLQVSALATLPDPPGSATFLSQNALKNTEVDYGAETLIEYDGDTGYDDEQEEGLGEGDETIGGGDGMDIEGEEAGGEGEEGEDMMKEEDLKDFEDEDMIMDADPALSKGEQAIASIQDTIDSVAMQAEIDRLAQKNEILERQYTHLLSLLPASTSIHLSTYPASTSSIAPGQLSAQPSALMPPTSSADIPSLTAEIIALKSENSALRYTFLPSPSTSATTSNPIPGANNPSSGSINTDRMGGVDLNVILERVKKLMRENEELAGLLVGIEGGGKVRRGEREIRLEEALKESQNIIESLDEEQEQQHQENLSLRRKVSSLQSDPSTLRRKASINDLGGGHSMSRSRSRSRSRSQSQASRSRSRSPHRMNGTPRDTPRSPSLHNSRRSRSVSHQPLQGAPPPDRGVPPPRGPARAGNNNGRGQGQGGFSILGASRRGGDDNDRSREIIPSPRRNNVISPSGAPRDNGWNTLRERRASGSGSGSGSGGFSEGNRRMSDARSRSPFRRDDVRRYDDRDRDRRDIRREDDTRRDNRDRRDDDDRRIGSGRHDNDDRRGGNMPRRNSSSNNDRGRDRERDLYGRQDRTQMSPRKGNGPEQRRPSLADRIDAPLAEAGRRRGGHGRR